MLDEPPTSPSGGRAADSGGLACPTCAASMQSVGTNQGVEVDQCVECGAVWLDAGELAAILRAESGETSEATPVSSVRELRARMRTVVPQPGSAVRYRECPRCGEVMDRRNFGTISGVVIDECKRHGVLLDEGELPAIEEFVRLGGEELGAQALAEQSERQVPPPPESMYRPGERRTTDEPIAQSVSDRLWSLLFGERRF